MSEPRTKQQILDDLERQAHIIAGEIAIWKIGLAPRGPMVEDCLGKIINGILELKQIEGVPSNLNIVEGKIQHEH